MHAWEASRGARLVGPLGLAGVVALGVAGLSSTGLDEGSRPIAGVLSSFLALIGTGPIPLAYMLAAFGLGRLAMFGSLRASTHRHWIQVACGLALMLCVSHLLGVFGLLSGSGHMPRIAAWGFVTFGLLLLVDQVIRGSLRPERWPVMSRTAPLWGVALALVLVAACNPPGWLWRSEHGAYDALSYHLQLPKEWAAGHRLWPQHHNVYSFLPSYTEAAFQHIGIMMPGAAPDPSERMLGGDGSWVIACQLLHAAMAILAALLAGRAVAALLERLSIAPSWSIPLASCAGLWVLATPWMTAVGSLAYNEGAMLALMAGSLLVALDVRLGPWARGAIAGLLIGAATSAKPTGALFGTPMLAVMLLSTAPRRDWWRIIVPGTLCGAAVIAPWLIRNAVDAGNPVFPFAYKLLGTGHWTLEQCERYARNHASTLGVGSRLALLCSEERGLLHPQWGMFAGVLGVGVILGLVARATHVWTVRIVVAIVLQIAAWMAFTHLQSRFLLPLLLPGVLLLALAIIAGRDLLTRNRLKFAKAPLILVMLLAAITSGWGVLLFLAEGGGVPNRLLVGGVGGMTGLAFEPSLESMPQEKRREFELRASPHWYCNLFLKADKHEGGLYLLGDATPLYDIGAVGDASTSDRVPVTYHTTWDRSPLGDAIELNPESPRVWSKHMTDSGIRFVLVNFNELSRLVERDHNYDPRVTLDRVAQWITDTAAGLKEVRRWNAGEGAPASHILYRLTETTP